MLIEEVNIYKAWLITPDGKIIDADNRGHESILRDLIGEYFPYPKAFELGYIRIMYVMTNFEMDIEYETLTLKGRETLLVLIHEYKPSVILIENSQGKHFKNSRTVSGILKVTN